MTTVASCRFGSTEQHAYLSLSVDSILSERVASEAAEPLGVPVFPVLAYGFTPYFQAFPGTDLAAHGDLCPPRAGYPRRAAIAAASVASCCATATAATAPAGSLAIEWMADHPGTRASASITGGARRRRGRSVQQTDKVASHASWMENFPWTRLPNIRGPETQKPMTDLDRLRLLDPGERAAPCWTTVITAASTSGPMPTCWRSGPSRSRKPAPSSKARGSE